MKLVFTVLAGWCFLTFMQANRAQAGPGQNPSADPQKASAQQTLWLIPHTHWEGAVFKTREEYLEIGLPHILTALSLLRTHPEYRFVLDQVAYVRPFLERYPEQAAAFRQYVAEGRLQIVCGNDVMLDVNMPSGESWVRQVLYGKGYYRDSSGSGRQGGLGTRYLRPSCANAAAFEAGRIPILLVPARRSGK